MATMYAQKWGRYLEDRGYTQLPNLLLRRWREIGLSRTERDNISIIISYQDNPNEKAVPSARQLAYESGCGYDTTRRNLRRLCAPVVDEAGKVVRKQLLHAVPLKNGRIRYAMTALRHALEKLDASPALAIVKPAKVRPAPKPAPIVTLYEERGIDAEMTSKAQVDEDAVADWEEIKECIRGEVSDAAYQTWIAPTRGRYRDSSEVLHIDVPSSAHESMLMGRFKDIIDRCRKLYGIASIACRVLMAATVGV